jgi:hypothetical protein
VFGRKVSGSVNGGRIRVWRCKERSEDEASRATIRGRDLGNKRCNKFVEICRRPIERQWVDEVEEREGKGEAESRG